MGFTRLNADVGNISKLEDTPELEARQVKAAFDKAGVDIKGFLNEGFLQELEAVTAAENIGAAAFSDITAETVQGQLVAVRAQAVQVDTRETITGEKTFSLSPHVPVATVDTAAVRFGQVKEGFYTKAEMGARVDMDKGAIATVNGIAAAGGEVALVGKTGIRLETDIEGKEVRFFATGEAEPAAHGHTHHKGSVDGLTAEDVGACSVAEYAELVSELERDFGEIGEKLGEKQDFFYAANTVINGNKITEEIVTGGSVVTTIEASKITEVYTDKDGLVQTKVTTINGNNITEVIT